jgi:hypothetical protein
LPSTQTDDMKQLIILFFSVYLPGCNQNPGTQNGESPGPDKRNYAKELIDNGFLQYTDSSKADSLKIQLSNSFNIYEDANFKIAHIDAEELSEFSFDFFLPALNAILIRRGFNLSAQKLNDDDKSFHALINGDTVQLYAQKDLENDTFWDIAPGNFFRKVNELLKIKNINEQFYLLYSANDLHAMLLTEKEFSIISDYFKDNEKDKPYRP